jgi:HEAT repeat protein
MESREREHIEHGLASADDELRRLAVEQLALLPPDDALPRLVACLGDDSWRVRKAAVERLAGAPESWLAAPALVEALGDGENPGRRNAAVDALVQCGGKAVPALLAATASPDVDVRKLVVDALAGIGDERALPALVARLEDADPNVRAAAADGLGAHGGDVASRALVACATRAGEDRLVRFSALRALARLEPAIPARDLEGALDDRWLRAMAFRVLGASDDEAALEHLVKGLAASSRSVREAAMEALLRWAGRLEDPPCAALVARVREVGASGELVPDAVARLESADLPTRLVLVQFLGLLAAASAATPVLRAGCDEALAEVALASLEAMGEPAARALDAEWSTLDAPSRRLACLALGRIGGTAGAARLVHALDDADPAVRTTAAAALGQRASVSAVPALVRGLERAAENGEPDAEDEFAAFVGALVAVAHTDLRLAEQTAALLAARIDGAAESVRLAIATVLGRAGRPEDAALVTLLLKDASDRVRRAAVEALARLEPDATPEPLRLALADESPLVRVAAAGALGACASARALEDLSRLADDSDPWVRAAALRAVGAQAARHPAQIAVAFGLLEAGIGGEGPVAMAAVEALAAMGGVAAARAAQRVLGHPDPELVRAAVACIGAHGDAEALESLLAVVSHDHWAVRSEAIEVLAARRAMRAVPPILRRLEIEQDEFVRAAILRALQGLEA